MALYPSADLFPSASLYPSAATQAVTVKHLPTVSIAGGPGKAVISDE